MRSKDIRIELESTYLSYATCLIISFFCFSSCFAQKAFTKDLSVATNYHYGFVLPEYQNFIRVVNAPVQSLELNISKKTTGKSDWEQLYNYPEYGFSFFYSTLGNDDVLGREIALYPFFRLNMISKKNFSFYNQTGVGISYVSKKFDLKSNYLDIAVGSHFNIHFNLRFGASYQLNKISLQTGIGLDHFSNGNLKEPNLGVNYTTLYAGLGYQLGNSTLLEKHQLQPHQKDYRYELIYSFGGKHTRALQSKFYYTTSGTFELKWLPFRFFHPGIGIDLFYDSSTQIEMQALKLTQHKNIDDYRTGIHLSQEFVYNRLSLILQEGIYLLLTDKVNHHVMYNRGIVRYRIFNHILLSIAMKSHLHILDYPEFGIGYTW